MRDPDKPQQIIEAAIRVFARNGYYNSRVSDIAREAGIASGTIYLYFKTKDEILVTLFREKMARVRGPVRREDRRRARRRGQDPADRAPCTSRCSRKTRARRGGAGRAAAGPEVLPRRLGARGLRLLRADQRPCSRRAPPPGQFRRDLPMKVATKMLFGAMDQMATSWVLGKRGYRLAEAADARRRHLPPGPSPARLAPKERPSDGLRDHALRARGELRGHHAEPAARQRDQRAADARAERGADPSSGATTRSAPSSSRARGDRIFCAGADLGSAFSGRRRPPSSASATACSGGSSGSPSRSSPR